MPAEPLAIAEKFSALDGLELVWIPTIADVAGLVATRPEIDGGVDLTDEVIGWDGFNVDPQEISTPGLNRFQGSIPGLIQITSGVLRLYADRQGGEDAGTVLADGTTGYLAWMDNGDVATEKMDVWPVQVNRCQKVRATDAATMWEVRFSHPRLPVEGITIPAYATP